MKVVPGGRPVQVWGQRMVTDTTGEDLPRPVWDVDKGVILAFVMSSRSPNFKNGVWILATEMKLLTLPDANVALGDAVQVGATITYTTDPEKPDDPPVKHISGGQLYLLGGDPEAWSQQRRAGVSHLEIPLYVKEPI